MTENARMHEETPETELVSGVLRADEGAFREVVRRYGRYLYGIALSLTGNAADAEDVVQEGFSALLKRQFRAESSLKTYLVSVVVRQCALLRRKARPTLRIASDDSIEDSARPLAEIDARMDLATLLSRLSMEHREVLVLRELENMSYDEMSTILDVPRGTIESRLHRAREQMRQMKKQVE